MLIEDNQMPAGWLIAPAHRIHLKKNNNKGEREREAVKTVRKIFCSIFERERDDLSDVAETYHRFQLLTDHWLQTRATDVLQKS